MPTPFETWLLEQFSADPAVNITGNVVRIARRACTQPEGVCCVLCCECICDGPDCCGGTICGAAAGDQPF
jgi:hypothetical protein